jgi:hypothetical protein
MSFSLESEAAGGLHTAHLKPAGELSCLRTESDVIGTSLPAPTSDERI